MANIKSQIKRNRQNEKRHQRNKGVRTALKTASKKVSTAARAFFVAVFRLERTALFRSCAFALWRFRLIWDLMFATARECTSGAVPGTAEQVRGAGLVAARTMGPP